MKHTTDKLWKIVKVLIEKVQPTDVKQPKGRADYARLITELAVRVGEAIAQVEDNSGQIAAVTDACAPTAPPPSALKQRNLDPTKHAAPPTYFSVSQEKILQPLPLLLLSRRRSFFSPSHYSCLTGEAFSASYSGSYYACNFTTAAGAPIDHKAEMIKLFDILTHLTPCK